MRPVLFALIGLAVALLAFRYLMRRGRVDPGHARTLVGQGALLLDVRTPAEFAAGHLAGARNVALQDLAAATGGLGPKATPLVVYCKSGMRSRMAATVLRRAGFVAVHDLGPMAAWPATA